MNDQQVFISTVAAALGQPGKEQQRREGLFAPVDPERHRVLLDRIGSRSRDQQRQLLDNLIQNARPLNLQVIPVDGTAETAAAITELVCARNPEWGDRKSVVAWQHPLIDALHLPDMLDRKQIPVYVETTDPQSTSQAFEDMHTRVVESIVGITAADHCVAETASLVIKSGAGRARSISLVPAIHVAVIRLEQIVADLSELYALLKEDGGEDQHSLTNCMTLITGPSKTADIELNLVHGAHGPRELHLYVIIS